MENQPNENDRSADSADGVVEFQERNDVHKEIIHIFQQDKDLSHKYQECLKDVMINNGKVNTDLIPHQNKILRALSRCPPANVKVVILGHDPVKDAELASGFSFSFPEGKRKDENVGDDNRPLLTGRGRSLAILHDVLIRGGWLEKGATYDCCHEIWADRGVLLLNSSLTYGKGHFEIWQEFMEDLLYQSVALSKQEQIFIMCWGTNAEVLGNCLSSRLKESKMRVQTIRDGDHSETINQDVRVVMYIGNHPTWPRDPAVFVNQALNQFLAVDDRYTDIFTLPKYEAP